MTKSNEKFLKIIEDAESITETIRKLQAEIASYSSINKSLEQVRNDLLNYLIITREASDSLLQLSNTISERMDDIAENGKQVNAKIEQGFLEVNNKLAEYSNEIQIKVEQGILEFNSRASGLKTMIIIAIIVSLASIIVALFV